MTEVLPQRPHRRDCRACGAPMTDGTGWLLHGYFGLYGYFCARCYDKVSHDSYGKPNDPEAFAAISVALKLAP